MSVKYQILFATYANIFQFSRLLPFHALGEPMLLNAFLACGARHLTLVNPQAYHEGKALNYYDTATSYLLKTLQNPNRDTVLCATTAVILNVYEIMSEKASQRMNHIAGARALIKECGWSARSTGIGAACFWLNVGMELLSCLHFNWQVAWEPDDWGVDMDFSRETETAKEELWTYRIVYIVAKIANFRATIPRHAEADEHAEQMRLQQRYAEWKRLLELCNAWQNGIPRTMQPMAYLYPYQTASKSAFPEIWYVNDPELIFEDY
jgi:Fungal specific transcription factor domain